MNLEQQVAAVFLGRAVKPWHDGLARKVIALVAEYIAQQIEAERLRIPKPVAAIYAGFNDGIDVAADIARSAARSAPTGEPDGSAVKVIFSVYRDGRTNGLQLLIEDERGGGYRVFGPKFNGSGSVLAKGALTARDADEIRRYLDRAFPRPTGEAKDNE